MHYIFRYRDTKLSSTEIRKRAPEHIFLKVNAKAALVTIKVPKDQLTIFSSLGVNGST